MKQHPGSVRQLGVVERASSGARGGAGPGLLASLLRATLLVRDGAARHDREAMRQRGTGLVSRPGVGAAATPPPPTTLGGTPGRCDSMPGSSMRQRAFDGSSRGPQTHSRGDSSAVAGSHDWHCRSLPTPAHGHWRRPARAGRSLLRSDPLQAPQAPSGATGRPRSSQPQRTADPGVRTTRNAPLHRSIGCLSQK